MVFMKSTIIYITVAISLLASQGQAAPMHKNDVPKGDIVHVSPTDGVVSKALGVDVGKQELENVKLSHGGKSGLLPTKRGFLTRPIYGYGGRHGGGNVNFNGIGNGNGYPPYGFGRSNVGVNGFTRPIGFNGNGDDDSELFDDVSAAKAKVKRDHHDHDHGDDDISEALAIANQVTCSQPRPSHCQTQQDWHGYHGFMKRHDFDDINIGANHHWGCPTIAPPCLPRGHGWGHTLDFDKRDEGAQAKDEGKSSEKGEGSGASENKRDTNANADASAVTEESVDGIATASAGTSEEELSKRDWDEDHYGGGIWAGRRPGRYPGHYPRPYPPYGYPRPYPPYGYP
ncbi:hypothetical protein BJ944DRAFT_52549, partial [Cunninghamella echinulata]